MLGKTYRRQFLKLGAAAPAGLLVAQPSSWDETWDRALLDAALKRLSTTFNPAEQLLRSNVGPEYRYHTALRSQVVHPTRESLHYALLLLEQGSAASAERAMPILDRILQLQDTQPDSKWYGLWGWYLEEPAAKMQPADWNWADFLGSYLLLIRHRHSARIEGALRERLDAAIRHSAYSVMRRNVSMGYTNIAVKGTFVTLSAAELLGDPKLQTYARDRLVRLSAEIDKTGSFNEYNSPTYNRVSLENFARMRMVWKDPGAVAQARRIEERMWDHLSRHWHAGTRQVAGPMSRCYATDIGKPVWLQKALRNQLRFVSLDEVRSGAATSDPETAYIDFTCPAQFLSRFLEAGPSRQVREVFLPPSASAKPTQGTTWLTPAFAFGSVNQGDFWVQRRPLLVYWRGENGALCSAQLRVMKDDYDFSSALFYSVQHQDQLLGIVNFRNPGGDKHISLDPIQDGRFRARSLRLQLDLTGVTSGDWDFQLFGNTAGPDMAEVRVKVGDQVLVFAFLQPQFPGPVSSPYVRGSAAAGWQVNVPWFGWEHWENENEEREVVWKDVPAAFAVVYAGVFHARDVEKSRATPAAVAHFDTRTGELEAKWNPGGNSLSLRAGGTIAAVEVQSRRFDGGTVNGSHVPLVRLSDNLLAARFRP